MSTTLLGWLLILSSIAIAAPIVFPLRSTGARLRAAAAGLARLPRLRSWSGGSGQGLRGRAGTLGAAAAVFVLVAGLGAVSSHVGAPPKPAGSGDTGSGPLWHSGLDGETLARLEDYARNAGTEEPMPAAAADEMLPDVDTMIERLAARLLTAPDNVDGWRMLGWSYFNTARYEEAATAYAKAAELDPSSAELKLAFEEAKAKASESDKLEVAASLQTSLETEAVGEGNEGERDASIRAMVDGLADRLESSPRDAEGWTRLMRSRVVLGEREAATAAFRKALEIFKDDSAASTRIEAAAIELGLKAE